MEGLFLDGFKLELELGKMPQTHVFVNLKHHTATAQEASFCSTFDLKKLEDLVGRNGSGAPCHTPSDRETKILYSNL